MSSNCSEPETILTLLAASFDALAAEAPRHHARFTRALVPHRVQLCVDDEILSVASDGAAPSAREGADEAATVRIATSTETILEVLGARSTVAAAVQAGRLNVIAPLDELMALHEALLVYVRGGVRSASLPGLIARLRARAAAVGGGDR